MPWRFIPATIALAKPCQDVQFDAVTWTMWEDFSKRAGSVSRPSLTKKRMNFAIWPADVGASDLVAYDSKLIPFGGEPDDCLQEIFPGRRIDPGRSYDKARRSAAKEEPLALCFAFSVDRQGVDGMAFVIRFCGLAVENVVGRKMDQRHVISRGPLTEDSDGVSIDGIGDAGLRTRPCPQRCTRRR